MIPAQFTGIQIPVIFRILEYSEPKHVYNTTHIQSLTNVYDKLLVKWLSAINIFAKLSLLDVWRGSEYNSMSQVRSNLYSDFW